MIKVDMHVHTSCSPDSLISAEGLLEICDRKGIDCVAITDHDAIECALRLHERAPSRIIIGEEIHTTSGEIIGLFLKEHIQPWLSPMETIERIKDQGGLVYIPHPFDGMRDSVLKREALEEICGNIDIIEVSNSRNTFPWSNRRALDFALRRDIAFGAGSDAHSQYELGRSYVIVEPFDSAVDFLSKLTTAQIHARKTPLIFNLATKMYKILKGIS